MRAIKQRQSSGSRRIAVTRRFLSVLIALMMAASTALLLSCDNGSSSGQGASAATTPAAVRKVQPYTIVNASDVAQAHRSLAANNKGGWPPVEFEPANLNFGIVPPHTIGKGSGALAIPSGRCFPPKLRWIWTIRPTRRVGPASTSPGSSEPTIPTARRNKLPMRTE